MDHPSKKKWLIKNRSGKIEGPYSTEEVMQEIRTGRFTGDEEISLFPGTKWYGISSHPNFYDLLLSILSGEIEEEPPQQNKKVEDDFGDEKTQIDLTPPSQRKKTSKSKEPPKVKVPPQKEVIDLKPVKELKKKVQKKNLILPIFLISLALIIIVFAFLWTPPEKEHRIHLILPALNKPSIEPQIVEEKLKRGKAYHFRDNLEFYLKAENQVVQALEGQPENPKAISQLCAIYYELWPYSYQDSKDFKIVSTIIQRAAKKDPSGIHSGTCRTIGLIIRGQWFEAREQLMSLMSRFSGGRAAPTILYYLKARQLYESRDYQSALSYIVSAQKLEPKWLKLYFFEAQVMQKLGNTNQAASRYRQILHVNKKHVSAQVALALIEYKSFRHYEKAHQLLLQAVKSISQLTKKEAAEAYLALAEIALYSANKEKALEFAKNSYSMNPTNIIAKNLVIKLGGIDQLKKTSVQGEQLILEGDQYAREGNCNVAQQHYKAAYNQNKKNGVAAMKAGKCLWKLSFTTEALAWLNKAIKADPKLTEAYIALADYYSQRNNFLAAATILAKAQRESPKSYEVYRGYALVEMRRRNYTGAVQFAEKALKLYSLDVATYILLAQALMKKGDYGKAYTHARQALEFDANNQEADITYAKTLAGVQGINSALSYLEKKIEKFPLSVEYRMALAQLFASEEYYSKAEEIYRQILQIGEKPKQALIELGEVLRFQQKNQLALEIYMEAALLDPADVKPLFNAGQLYLDIKKPDKAKEQFLKVKQINPNYPLVHYYLGKAFLDMNQPQKAIEYSEEERKKNPNLADSYILAAEAYTRMIPPQYTLCAKEYQKAISLRPQGAFIYVKLARCYRLTGNLDIAESMLGQALKKESGLPEIYKEQGQIFEMQSYFQRAIDAYNQYLILNPSASDAAEVKARLRYLGEQ